MKRFIDFVTKDRSLDFMSKRIWGYSFTIILVIASIFSIYFKGLNFGIDFSGGLYLEIKTEKAVNLKQIRSTLDDLNIGGVEVQSVKDNVNEAIIRVAAAKDEASSNSNLINIKEALNKIDNIEYRKVEVVGPKVGSELIKSGTIACILAIILIGAYVWFRFELPYAIGATLSLISDALTTVGIFSILQLDFSLTTLAAILTLVGYSVNDTVVNYDRVRSNVNKYKKMSVDDLINLSINQMLTRTILTSLTVLFAVLALLIFGGDVLWTFSFAMTWGVCIGVFSTIYIAMPILRCFDLRKHTKLVDDPYANVG